MVFLCIMLILIYFIQINPGSKKEQQLERPRRIIFTVLEPIQVTNDTAHQENAAIYGDSIVWQDDRNGNWDIYMYNLTKKIRPLQQITYSTNSEYLCDIFQNKIVYIKNALKTKLYHSHFLYLRGIK